MTIPSESAMLLSGDDIRNHNRSVHVNKTLFYVCPVCGNVILAAGEAVISCCGITLPPCQAEPTDEAHAIHAERSEDEYYYEYLIKRARQHHTLECAVLPGFR